VGGEKRKKGGGAEGGKTLQRVRLKKILRKLDGLKNQKNEEKT